MAEVLDAPVQEAPQTDKLGQLYSALKSDPTYTNVLPDEKAFRETMNNPEKASALHDVLLQDETYKSVVPKDFADFAGTLELGKKEQPATPQEPQQQPLIQKINSPKIGVEKNPFLKPSDNNGMAADMKQMTATGNPMPEIKNALQGAIINHSAAGLKDLGVELPDLNPKDINPEKQGFEKSYSDKLVKSFTDSQQLKDEILDSPNYQQKIANEVSKKYSVPQQDVLNYISKVNDTKKDIRSNLADIALNPQNDKAYGELGNNYYGIGEYDNAEKAYMAALSVDPNSEGAKNGLGSVALQKKDYPTAVQMFRELASVNPNTDNISKLATAVYGTGDFAKAHELADAAVNAGGDMPDAYALKIRAVTNAVLGDNKQSIADTKASAEIEGMNEQQGGGYKDENGVPINEHQFTPDEIKQNNYARALEQFVDVAHAVIEGGFNLIPETIAAKAIIQIGTELSHYNDIKGDMAAKGFNERLSEDVARDVRIGFAAATVFSPGILKFAQQMQVADMVLPSQVLAGVMQPISSLTNEGASNAAKNWAQVGDVIASLLIFHGANELGSKGYNRAIELGEKIKGNIALTKQDVADIADGFNGITPATVFAIDKNIAENGGINIDKKAVDKSLISNDQLEPESKQATIPPADQKELSDFAKEKARINAEYEKDWDGLSDEEVKKHQDDNEAVIEKRNEIFDKYATDAEKKQLAKLGKQTIIEKLKKRKADAYFRKDNYIEDVVDRIVKENVGEDIGAEESKPENTIENKVDDAVEARIERRLKNRNLTEAKGSTFYEDTNLKNAKVGDEIHFSQRENGEWKDYKTKVKSIVDGKIIFENGKTEDDVSSYMNITAEDAWFAKNHPELTLDKSSQSESKVEPATQEPIPETASAEPEKKSLAGVKQEGEGKAMNSDLENRVFEHDGDIKSEIKAIDKAQHERGNVYYLDSTTLKNAPKETLDEIKAAYKPVIDKIKSEHGSDEISLYRSQETFPSGLIHNGEFLSFTTRPSFAKYWNKEKMYRDFPLWSFIAEVKVPFDDIVLPKTNLGQYEFVVENKGKTKEYFEKQIEIKKQELAAVGLNQKSDSGHLELAIKEGRFQKAISEGKMKQSDAIELIEGAGLEVPEDIKPAANKESAQVAEETPLKSDVTEPVSSSSTSEKPTPDESRQFAIDFVNHDLVEVQKAPTKTKGENNRPSGTNTAARLDLGMSNEEKISAIKQIKSGKYDGVAAKKLLDKLIDMHQRDDFAFIQGTGGNTEMVQDRPTRQNLHEAIEIAKLTDSEYDKQAELDNKIADHIAEHGITTVEDVTALEGFPLSHEDAELIKEYLKSKTDGTDKESTNTESVESSSKSKDTSAKSKEVEDDPNRRKAEADYESELADKQKAVDDAKSDYDKALKKINKSGNVLFENVMGVEADVQHNPEAAIKPFKEKLDKAKGLLSEFENNKDKYIDERYKNQQDLFNQKQLKETEATNAIQEQSTTKVSGSEPPKGSESKGVGESNKLQEVAGEGEAGKEKVTPPKPKLKFKRNTEKISNLDDEIKSLITKSRGETNTLVNFGDAVKVVAKLIERGIYKAEDIAKYLIERGYNDVVPHIKDALKHIKENFELDPEVKTALNNDALQQGQTGVRHADVDVDAELMGMNPVEKMQAIPRIESEQSARKIYESQNMAAKVIDLNEKPRPINNDEQGALQLYIAELKRKSAAIFDQWQQAKLADNTELADELKIQLDDIRDGQLTPAWQALKNTRSQAARTLGNWERAVGGEMQFEDLRMDYMRAKNVTEVPPEIEAQLKKAADEYAELEKKYNDALAEDQAKAAKIAAQEKLLAEKREQEREYVKQKIKSRHVEKAQQVKEIDERIDKLKERARVVLKKSLGQMHDLGGALKTSLEFADVVKDIVNEHIKKGLIEGKVKFEDIIDKAHQDLHEIFEDITTRDIHEIYSDYGVVKKPRVDDLAKAKREIKAEAFYASATAEAKEGTPPFKRVNPGKESPNVRAARQEMEEAMKNSGIEWDKRPLADRRKSALDKTKQTLQNQINDLTKAVEDDKIIRRERNNVTLDEAADNLVKLRDEAKEIYKEHFGDELKAIDDARKIKTVQQALDKLNKRIEKGDFTDKVTEKTTNADLIAIREQLKDAHKKFAELREIADPEYNNRKYNERLENAYNKLAKKYAERDENQQYANKAKTTQVISDKTFAAWKAKEAAKRAFERNKLRWERDNQTRPMKIATRVLRYIRQGAISRPSAILKLGAFALQEVAFKPLIDRGIARGITKTIFPKLAKSVWEGQHIPISEEVKTMKATWDKFGEEAVKIWKTGEGSIDVAGKKVHLEPSLIETFGIIHTIEKSLIKNTTFGLSFQTRLEMARRNGEPVDNEAYQFAIWKDALKDANRSILLGDNYAMNMYKRAFQITGKENPTEYAAKFLANFLMPVVKVGTNFTLQSYERSFGTYTGTAKYIIHKALAETGQTALEKMTPAQRERTYRMINNGMMGTALGLIGWYGYKNIGGYYIPNQKKKDSDVKEGDIKLTDSMTIPHLLLHNPRLAPLLIGATAHKILDYQLKKGKIKDADYKDVLSGLYAASLGIYEENPFAVSGEHLSKLTDMSNIGTNATDLLVKPFIPGVIQELAVQHDNYINGKGTWANLKTGNLMERKAHSPTEDLELAIPYLRENVTAGSSYPISDTAKKMFEDNDVPLPTRFKPTKDPETNEPSATIQGVHIPINEEQAKAVDKEMEQIITKEVEARTKGAGKFPEINSSHKEHEVKKAMLKGLSAKTLKDEIADIKERAKEVALVRLGYATKEAIKAGIKENKAEAKNKADELKHNK